jgi:hypothetical protein
MQVRLKGKSRKGKNRIHERGEWWTILESRESPQCLPTTGPALLIESQDKKSIRWISEKNDIDFEIVERKNESV